MSTTSTKTPTAARRLFRTLSLCVALLFAPVFAWAQDGWGVELVVQRALANPQVDALFKARVEARRTAIEVATAAPNPGLELSHQQVFGSDRVGYLESSAMVQQRFDLSDWRGRLRSTLAPQERALRAQTDGWRLQVATAVRLAFFAVRYRQARQAIFEAWVVQLGRGVTVIEARQRRGDAATYAVRRVQRELATARARQALEGSLLAEAWADLSRWVPSDESQELVGPLLPGAPPATRGAIEQPALRRLEHQREALSAEAEVLRAPFWRGWSAGLGYRFAEAGGARGHGVLLSLAVPLVLRNNDRLEAGRLHAERARLGEQLQLGRTLATQAEQAARRRLAQTMGAVERLPARAAEGELTRLAELAYSADEAPLTTLLDAYESEAALRLSRVDLTWAARRAAVELDRVLGLGVPR